MELMYKNEKLKNYCENPNYNKELQKKYGKEVADKLPLRIKQLKSFRTLNDIPVFKPYRRHKLVGNKRGLFGININDQYRIIIKVNENNEVIVEDLKEITKIMILEVSKHYE